MAETTPSLMRGGRGFGTSSRTSTPTRGRGRGSKNKHWIPTGGPDNERWERGGHRGGRGRGRGRGNLTATFIQGKTHRTVDLSADPNLGNETEGEEQDDDRELPLNATEDERAAFWEELQKAREVELKTAIAEGAMDDPHVSKRLEDAITMVGTCMDMCPRFERYRRERENNLTKFEVIPGTKRVDHRKAVKMYERAAGDKTIPSDLRPPLVLKKTLDYLFGVLLQEKGFSDAHGFVRDRSRAVRADFTMQHEEGQLAIECHQRCVRFHILAMHVLGKEQSFLVLEERLLMNTLQSLKEFYEDQLEKFESPLELETRVYRRLVHIRDQTEWKDVIPNRILEDRVFQLITSFKQHVQENSPTISKNSKLVVKADGVEIFAELGRVLDERDDTIMRYLIACIFEWLFDEDILRDLELRDLEKIRGDLLDSDIIDGVSRPRRAARDAWEGSFEEIDVDENLQSSVEHIEQGKLPLPVTPDSIPPQIASVFGGSTSSPFGMTRKQDLSAAPPKNAFSALVSTPSPFTTGSVFGGTASLSVFGGDQLSSAFAQPAPGPTLSLSEKPSEPILQFHHPNGLPFSRLHSSFFPSPIVQSTPPSTLPPSRTVLELPLPQTVLSETPLPPEIPLNPSAPVFVPLNPSLPVPPLSSSSPPKPPRPVLVSTFATPKPPAPSAESFSPLLPYPLEVPQTTSATPLLKSIQTSLGLPEISGPRRPPRINTDLTSNGTTSDPKVPPQLKRTEPISLPPTTPHTPLTSHPSFKRNKSFKSFSSIQSIQTPGDILSPLNLTPSINAQEFSFTIPAYRQPELSAATGKLDSIAAEEAKMEEGKVNKNRSQWIADAKEKATSFKRRGILVKNCFSRWKQRLMDKVEYLEALEKSEEYSKKLRIERESSTSVSISSSGGDRKRRVSGMSPDTAQRKRARKRQSIKYAPQRTEDDLVKTLQENHEENERRWAPGTFTTSLRGLGRDNPNWLVWLSINERNDGTAIWLQRKFDVPSSGTWLSDKIFQICPASTTLRAGDGAPGLIIFECTPFDDFDDELEKKYQILDDCTRLRGVLSTLPEGRHFIPSLLVIIWQPSALSPDFQTEVSEFVGGGILKSFSTFAMTMSMKDADSRFLEAVSSVQLDLEGELAVKCTGSSLVRSLTAEWMENLSEWTESCLVDGRVDWASYGEVLQASSRIMNSISNDVTTLIKTKAIHIPAFVAENARDRKSALGAITSWLDDPRLMRVSGTVLIYVQSCETTGADFSISDFSSRLPQLLSAALSRTFHTSIYILKEEYDDLFKRFVDQLRSENDALVESRAIRNSRLLFKRPLPSSKGLESRSNCKRARTIRIPSPSLSFVEEPPSPSSRSLSATPPLTLTKPAVTLKSLREITKSMMKSYQT